MSIHLILRSTKPLLVFGANIACSETVTGGTATSYFTFLSAGTTNQKGNDYKTANWTWLLAGAASDYEINVSVGSPQTVAGDSTNTWLGLGTTRQWTLTATGTSKHAAGTYSIRKASGGLVLGTWTYDLLADGTP